VIDRVAEAKEASSAVLIQHHRVVNSVERKSLKDKDLVYEKEVDKQKNSLEKTKFIIALK
jgi:hypothetical protein